MNANQDLAKRAVACKGFRWMAGMLIHDTVSNGYWRCGMAPSVWLTPYGEHDLRIDLMDYRRPGIGFRRARKFGLCLSDPATRGCLLELVRQAHNDPSICTWTNTPGMDDSTPQVGPWDCGSTRQYVNYAIAIGATESEALIAALEAAPQRCGEGK